MSFSIENLLLVVTGKKHRKNDVKSIPEEMESEYEEALAMDSVVTIEDGGQG